MRLLVLALVACSGGRSVDVGDGVDAPPVDPGTLPAWQLEDIQPQSPRAGQTYGLDSFAGKIIVVTLLEGF